MSEPQSAATEKRIRLQRPPGSTLVVKWPVLISLLQTAFRQIGWRLQIDGAESARSGSDGTLQFKIKPGGAADVIHPFYILADGTLHAGTVNGVIPELSGAPIGESGNALTLTGDFYVYICNVWAVTFSSYFFLETTTLSSTTIVTNSSPLADDLDPSGGSVTTYRLVAQVIGGVVQRQQQTTTNMTNLICDASTGAEGGEAVNTTWTPV